MKGAYFDPWILEAYPMKTLSILALSCTALCLVLPARAADADAAQALLKKSACMKCHSVSAKKEGPSFKDVAAKYKGQSDAEAKLVTHLTTAPTIKVGGAEEKHSNAKGS